jgi:hypothetical protein
MKVIRALFLALVAVILGLVFRANAQTTVVLAPIPIFSSYLQSGVPNSFGCLFTYYSNTTTPLTTYTDYTGVTQNPNPVVLSAGGTANVWLLSGQTYSFAIKSAGGVNCAYGSTVATVNGIGGGASTQTTPVAYSTAPTFTDTSQNQLFTFTLNGNAAALPLSVVGVTPPGLITFQITENSTGGYTFAWPPNVIGGAPINISANVVTTQEFIWNGTNATAIGPAMYGPNGAPGLSTFELSVGGNAVISGTATVQGYPVSSVIGAINTQITQTGDTALHTIYTIPITGGTIGVNGQIRITLFLGLNATSGFPAITVNYGGSAIAATNANPLVANTNGRFLRIIGGNLGATNSQSWDQEVASVASVISGGNVYHQSSAIDSTTTQNLTVTFQGGSSSDSITFYRCIVELL